MTPSSFACSPVQWLVCVLAEAFKKKLAAKKKRYYDRVMADPERKAKHRAKRNAWRKQHRKEHGSYPTQEHLDKASAIQRRLYNEKYKHDPAYKAATKERRARYQSTEHAKEYARNWRANRLRTDPAYRIYSTLVIRVNGLLGRRNNRKGTVELLGCSVPELKAQIEQQWEPGMSWANYGRGEGKWSIDHIRPCASFNLLDPAQANECFNHKNLRPSWSNYTKKSWYGGKHWFREKHPRYSPEICEVVPQLPACPVAPEPAQSAA
jgi:hypothetical protein